MNCVKAASGAAAANWRRHHLKDNSYRHDFRVQRHIHLPLSLVYRFEGKVRRATWSAQMMLVVFATLSLALLAGYSGPRWLAMLSMLVCLALSIGLFLFEIYSPEYGFRMPWLQVQFDAVPHGWSREANHEYGDRAPPGRDAQRSFSSGDDAGHRRDPDNGDGPAILRRRNPLPAVPAATRGDVRRLASASFCISATAIPRGTTASACCSRCFC